MSIKPLLFSLLGLILASPTHADPIKTHSSLPPTLNFVENRGQITDQYYKSRKDIDFRLSANGVHAFIGNAQIHYQWHEPIAASTSFLSQKIAQTPTIINSYRMDVSLLGANKNAVALTESPTDYTEQYFLADFGTKGVIAKSYQKITYKNIYPEIDWVLYLKNGTVEYDFVVHPGGKVADIRIQYAGTIAMGLNKDGSITATTPMGSVTEQAPYSYQSNGQKVNSHFVLEDQILSFRTEAYQGTLVIDPTLVWATYYGGNGIMDIAAFTQCDPQGNVYLCGTTLSTTNIATRGSFQTTNAGNNDGFLVKFNPSGVRLWGTYYGGPDEEVIWGMACDSLGHFYISGGTSSTTGIATAGSYQVAHSGKADVFLAKFDTAGTRQWATYYGGPEDEATPSLSSDGTNIYMVAATSSTTGIATSAGHQPLFGGADDAFLVKFNSAGQRQWATYYGGESTEAMNTGLNIHCDHKGDIYIGGTTSSLTQMASTGSHQPSLNGGNDGFLAKFNPSGQRQWATYYGGSDNDVVPGGANINCDKNNNVYLSGYTSSIDSIATPGSHQLLIGGDQDVFLVKFNSSGQRQWGTYYGGTKTEAAYSVVCGNADDIYITGNTMSADNIATPNTYQSTFAGGSFAGDVFLIRFNSLGERKWGTYYGGPGDENCIAAYDKNGYIYFSGYTNSVTGISTPDSHQPTFPGGIIQPFLAKFCISVLPENGIIGKDTLCPNTTATYSIPGLEGATANVWELPPGWTGSSNSASINITPNTESGTIRFYAVLCGDTSELATFPVTVQPDAAATINVNGFMLGTVSTYLSYQWCLNGKAIPGATQSTYLVNENGDYTVITTNSFGCIDTSAIYEVKNVVSISAMEQWKTAIKVYPNPASEWIQIQAPVTVNVRICSIEGKVIRKEQGVKTIDLRNVTPGIYLLHIFDEKGTLLKTEKLIRMK